MLIPESRIKENHALCRSFPSGSMDAGFLPPTLRGSLFRKTIFVIILTFASGPAALCQNLITNGGFETGDFTGWTQFGDTSFTGVCPADSPSQDCSGYTPFDGNFMASFGAVNSQGGVTQTISTTPGATYLVSFFLSNGADSPNSFDISFDGVTLASGTDVGFMHWQPFQFTQVATSDSATLSFAFYQVPDYFDLDDVSVEVVDTPEPSSFALLSSGLALGITLAPKVRNRWAHL